MEPAVVFVNFFSVADIARRAEVLIEADLPVTVADNSGDYDGPGTIIHPGRNVGFGAACNAAVADLGLDRRWVCFHNPDVDLAPERLTALVSEADHAGAAAIAPILATPTGVRPHGYHLPSPWRELGLPLKRRLHGAAGRRPTTPGSPTPATGNTSRRFGSGALLVVRRSAFEAVGGFDPRFVLYVEDADLWARLATTGRRALFSSTVVAVHRQGTGSPTTTSDRELLRQAGVQLFAEIHQSGTWRTFRAIHRARMTVARQAQSWIGTVLHQAWQEDEPPTVVARRLREGFESGAMRSSTTEPATGAPSFGP